MSSPRAKPTNNFALAARILCCPDCEADLGESLVCSVCARSLALEPDGIISALPASMEANEQSKDQLRRVIDAAGREEQAEKVVLYERAFHDEQAPYYDALFADSLPLGQYYKRLVHHQIYSYVRTQPFVVDLCCGTGKSSIPFLERGMTVIGIDVSREMLHIYKRKCEARGYGNVLLIHADASRPPLRKQSCGAIQLIGGLHHIQESARCVNTCCSALEDNGFLILHEPLKTGVTSKIARVLDDLYALADPVRVLKALGRRMGLKPKTAPSRGVPVPDFTPYEQPFTSPEELAALMPDHMEVLELRAQGIMSFREFPPWLQGAIGRPVGSLVVRLDDWLGRRDPANWPGDALFAVFKKRK